MKISNPSSESTLHMNSRESTLRMNSQYKFLFLSISLNIFIYFRIPICCSFQTCCQGEPQAACQKERQQQEIYIRAASVAAVVRIPGNYWLIAVGLYHWLHAIVHSPRLPQYCL